MQNLTMPSRWIHGAADCALNSDPALQVHQANADTWIFRQSKCVNTEGPFMYLLLGRERGLLLDTGARPDAGGSLPLRQVVDEIIERWSASIGQTMFEFVVAHSHGHGDHAFGDSQFVGRSLTSVVLTGEDSVKEFFQLDNWPDGSASFDLGGRELTILPIPGHEPASIAVYDHATEVMLTGDTLYPGVLIVEDWAAFAASAARLAAFSQQHAVRMVLGAHIEAKAAPRQFFAPRTRFQPGEHRLELTADQIVLLHQETTRMGEAPTQPATTGAFVIVPPPL